jgi:hypothetical protein
VTAVAGLEAEYRINPLYSVTEHGGVAELTLTFPDAAYEDEYGACRRYLPERARLELSDLRALNRGQQPPSLADLLARRVVLPLPVNYY